MRHATTLKKITPEELRARHDAGESPLVIDTLPAGHFEQVHIPEAENACVFEITFLQRIHQLLSGRDSVPIVVYGAGNNSLDSRTAAEKLSMAGYSDVLVLEGGLERWRQSGYPLAGSLPDDDDITRAHHPADGEYSVVTQESSIGWIGRNSNASHCGNVSLSGGRLLISNSIVQGSLTVDMESMINHNLAGSDLQQVLISHLKSEDFFLTEAFPAARLNIHGGRFTPTADATRPNCEIYATLDLRGVTNDLNFKATLVKWLDGNLHLTAHFDLDRTLWGITYGSGSYYQHLGMHTVFDMISIDLRIVAQKP